MPPPLRAQRYLDQCRKPDALKDLVARVQGLPFESVCAFYDEEVSLLTEPEQAFLGANDRYFLLTELLNRKDARHPWIYGSCREVEAKPYGYVDLWAREHFKTSIITVAGSIQEILCDPEITIGLFSATVKLAGAIIRQIMDELENNSRLKRLYADVLWDRPKVQAPLWSKDEGIIVRRVGNPREPTLSGWGLLDGMPVGYHFKLRKYDDVITEKNVTNPDQIQKITERWELSDNLSSGEGLLEVVGTRYFQGDTYEQMIDRGVVIPRLKPATDNGKADGKPVLFTKEQWERKKRTQRTTLAAQMLQNPLADGQAIFDPLTFRPYSLRPRTMNVYILGDYAGSKSKTSDRTAFSVIGVDAAKNKYLLDGFCHRMSLTDKWKCLSHLQVKWKDMPGVQNVQVGYEKYGANSDIDYFEREMREPGAPKFFIEVVAYAQELNNQSKTSRVGRLEPDLTSSAFYFPAKVWRPNASWWVTRERWTDPKGRVYAAGQEVPGPMPDGADGEPHVGQRVCLWSVDQSDGRIIYRPIPMDNATVRPTVRPTASDLEAVRNNEPFRIVHPIKRVDSEDNVYDVTHVAFEEFKAFPKSNQKDFVDATSRIFDINEGNGPYAPMIIDRGLLETPVYID